MIKTEFVEYELTMRKNIGTDKDENWRFKTVTGIVKNTKEKLGKIFAQNQEMLSFTHIVSENYRHIHI